MALMRTAGNAIARMLSLVPPAEQPIAQTPARRDPAVDIKLPILTTDPNNSPLMRAYARVMRMDNPILVQQLSKAGIGYRTNIGLLHETQAKNGRVKGLVQQRKTAALRREMWWQDRSTSATAQRCSAIMREVDNIIDTESSSMGGLMGDMHQALDASLYPWGVHFIEWGMRNIVPMTSEAERRRGRNVPVPVNIFQADHDRCGFDNTGRFAYYAITTEEQARELIAEGWVRVPGEVHWWYPNPWSYIVLNPFSYADKPYGGGRCPLECCVIPGWLDRQARIFHANFIERNTSPVATVERDVQSMGAGDTDLADIDDFLENIQQETGMKFPAGFHFKWHELMSQASPQAIENFRRECHYEMAGAILGQSSTSMTERSGSQSSAEVQERVADSIIALDSLMLQNFRNQIMRLTLGQVMPYARHEWPSFKVQIDNAQDLEKYMGSVKTFVELGGEVMMEQVARKLGIDERRPGAKLLEIQPAAYAQNPGNRPSQRKENKTPARRGQREDNRPAQSQAQSRNQRS